MVYLSAVVTAVLGQGRGACGPTLASRHSPRKAGPSLCPPAGADPSAPCRAVRAEAKRRCKGAGRKDTATLRGARSTRLGLRKGTRNSDFGVTEGWHSSQLPTRRGSTERASGRGKRIPGPAPREMTVLLAFLLAVGLPWAETNVTEIPRQSFMCHVCEEFYNLSCTNPINCETGDIFCVTVIVRMLVRFFYVSRQCTRSCPTIRSIDYPLQPYKSYVLLQPTPFLYASCCSTSLCNTDKPYISDTEWKYYREAGGATRGGSAGPALLLALAAMSLGLGGS